MSRECCLQGSGRIQQAERTARTRAQRDDGLDVFEEQKEGQRYLQCPKPTKKKIKPTKDSYIEYINKYSNPQEKGSISKRKRAKAINKQFTKKEIQDVNKVIL